MAPVGHWSLMALPASTRLGAEHPDQTHGHHGPHGQPAAARAGGLGDLEDGR
eukprot:CAMPEP_0175788240 /NCGR_PEP_ID=MMETSP0097-20121207/80768_1 /TAXON_ID=311494 /ORGANISM="Alexandrium monilatum, Strain CCMP3105" /LENGTH=51 /DNA_ID=CAMNT_0017099229 /DNA_START=34 /DNA_END=185 /DNA_ORIENTATION=+